MSWNHTQDYEQTTYQDYGARLGGGQFEKIWDLGESPLPPCCHWCSHQRSVVKRCVETVLLSASASGQSQKLCDRGAHSWPPTRLDTCKVMDVATM